MYAGTIIIQQVLGWNLYLSVCLLLAMAAIYTVAGGLTAVIYTDAMQTVIMLIGAFVLMGIGKKYCNTNDSKTVMQLLQQQQKNEEYNLQKQTNDQTDKQTLQQTNKQTITTTTTTQGSAILC